jgi:nicotinate-nucleotide pyrophosphorylase (carboxylating)
MNALDALLWLALHEDVGHGDITTDALVPAGAAGRALAVAREPFVLSGTRAFCRVFELLDGRTEVVSRFADGAWVAAEDPVLEVRGALRVLLTGERTALNLLQRLSGIATLTRRMVDAMAGSGCRLLDTRKTTPLWRMLEKEAVRHGGGHNHRFGLADGVLIKDNHLAAVGSLAEAVGRARRRAPHTLRVEVEVDTLEQLEEALQAGADVVLLDNFSLEAMHAAVALTGKRALLEASGGITLERVPSVAATGVDFISCGALTHSARAVDISFELLP